MSSSERSGSRPLMGRSFAMVRSSVLPRQCNACRRTDVPRATVRLLQERRLRPAIEAAPTLRRSTMSVHYPEPPFPPQSQPMPGATAAMQPRPDHGETSYKGSGKLKGMKAVITGGDSGIGRAVAIAYAREGADVLIAYLEEHDDAKEVSALVEKEGRKVVLMPGNFQDPA